MARKVSVGNGQFINQSNKKRPGRHSKSPNKRNDRKEYTITDWKDLGLIAEKTSRTRSKMINKLIKFYKENRGERTNGHGK